MKQALFCLALLVSGCGAIYTTPQVRETTQDGTSVNVVMLNASAISQANTSPYKPKTLPSAFFETVSSSGAGLRGAGALPDPAAQPQTRPNELALRLPPAAAVGPYRIGVSDVLVLATKTSASTVDELSGLLAAQNRRQGYTVQDDGAIAIPELGRLQVGGLTLEEAEALLFQRLVENQIDPTFSIEIAEFNSKKVSIGGAVRTPGVAPISLAPLYLDEALSAVGGVTTSDPKLAAVRIYRDGSLYQLPLDRVYNRAGLPRVRLIDGDSIFVDNTYDLAQASAYFEQQIRLTQARASAQQNELTRLQTEIDLRRASLQEARDNFRTREELGENDRDYVYITGEVKNQGRFTLPYGRKATLADALYDDGGVPTETGDMSQIYVLRANSQLTDMTAYQLDGANAANILLATRFELRPNDVIFVSEQPITRWNRVVSQVLPTLVASDRITQ